MKAVSSLKGLLLLLRAHVHRLEACTLVKGR